MTTVVLVLLAIVPKLHFADNFVIVALLADCQIEHNLYIVGSTVWEFVVVIKSAAAAVADVAVVVGDVEFDDVGLEFVETDVVMVVMALGRFVHSRAIEIGAAA